MPKPLFIIVILCFIALSCKKEKQNSIQTTDNIKITLISGNNQSVAIGYWLKDSIVVKVTNNGVPANDVDVQFVGSGCNEDLVTNVQTKADGTAKYFWIMAANQGSQTLNAVAIHQSKRIDSVSVSATATSSAGLPPRSACTPNPGGVPERILQLSTGRLITCFPSQTSLRYSDDNGMSWSPIKGFGAKHIVGWIATSPQDEIFAATEGEGVFYSKDAGDTWVDITPATFNKQDGIDDIAFTSSGKLIFTGTSTNIYISPDKGKTWASSGVGLKAGIAYQYPTELKNGDLYILGLSNILYKSTDGGKTWIVKTDPQVEHVTTIYVDSKGWFYKASLLTSSIGGVYVSKDNGATFEAFVSFPSLTDQPYLTSLSIEGDGYLYFGELATSIGRANNNNQYTDTYALTGGVPFPAYILTKSNVFIYSSSSGIFYY